MAGEASEHLGPEQSVWVGDERCKVEIKCHERIDVKSFGGWMVLRNTMIDSYFAHRYRSSKSSRAGSGPSRFRISRCPARAASSTAGQPMKRSSPPSGSTSSEEPNR